MESFSWTNQNLNDLFKWNFMSLNDFLQFYISFHAKLSDPEKMKKIRWKPPYNGIHSTPTSSPNKEFFPELGMWPQDKVVEEIWLGHIP